MPYKISEDCIGCGACAKKCRQNAIDGKIKEHFTIDPFLCIECGVCFNTCPRGAIINPQGIRSPQKNKKKKLVKAQIDHTLCAGCRNCFLNCPQNAIKTIKKNFFSGVYCVVNTDICAGCARCTEFCITGAVELR